MVSLVYLGILAIGSRVLYSAEFSLTITPHLLAGLDRVEVSRGAASLQIVLNDDLAFSTPPEAPPAAWETNLDQVLFGYRAIAASA